MPKRKTTEEFIADAIKVHGDKYVYDRVDYKNINEKVEIYCKVCKKYFKQSPREHLDGCGCPTCGRNRIKSKLYGVGINDLEEPISHNGKHFKFYKVWRAMMYRCYYKEFHKRERTYSECTVCEEWKYLSNFKKWFDENYIEGYELDKDILFEGNKEYSPLKCCFVPRELNFVVRNNVNLVGKKYYGIDKLSDGFRVSVCKRGKTKIIKGIESLEEAIKIYSDEKTKYAHELSEEYYNEGKINENIYNALKKYRYVYKWKKE